MVTDTFIEHTHMNAHLMPFFRNKANRGNSVIGVIPQSASLERRVKSCNTSSINCDYSTATPVLTTNTSLLCGPDEHAPKVHIRNFANGLILRDRQCSKFQSHSINREHRCYCRAANTRGLLDSMQ